MAFTERPPILRGSAQEQLNALRDYLFRMASSLEGVNSSTASAAPTRTGLPKKAEEQLTADTIQRVRKNAEELKALIIKSANEVQAYADSKTEEYNSLYVAKSDYGEFTETIESRIETTARGVVESYDYNALIQSAQDNIDLLQNYLTNINGEIRRGIVLDPDTGLYVTGIAISQNLKFTGECGPNDSNNPKDGYLYYYLNSGQTFGLYTSTGWQFWIDGYKKGWFNSVDGMLHVANVMVENTLQIGNSWQLKGNDSEFELVYIGG